MLLCVIKRLDINQGLIFTNYLTLNIALKAFTKTIKARLKRLFMHWKIT